MDRHSIYNPSHSHREWNSVTLYVCVCVCARTRKCVCVISDVIMMCTIKKDWITNHFITIHQLSSFNT